MHKPSPPSSEMRLVDSQGKRLYLTVSERDRFLKAAETAPREARTLCMVLAYTGCRLSEALALTADRVDYEAGQIVIESLKKRKRGVYRFIPVPPALLDALDMVHGVRQSQKNSRKATLSKLWDWQRPWGYKQVKAVMVSAELDGPHASPKGLRHGFGVHAIQKGIPLNMVQKWLGHASLSTTAIYADAVGDEERSIAERMW
jgi:integrase/recombinase XerD